MFKPLKASIVSFCKAHYAAETDHNKCQPPTNPYQGMVSEEAMHLKEADEAAAAAAAESSGLRKQQQQASGPQQQAS